MYDRTRRPLSECGSGEAKHQCCARRNHRRQRRAGGQSRASDPGKGSVSRSSATCGPHSSRFDLLYLQGARHRDLRETCAHPRAVPLRAFGPFSERVRGHGIWGRRTPRKTPVVPPLRALIICCTRRTLTSSPKKWEDVPRRMQEGRRLQRVASVRAWAAATPSGCGRLLRHAAGCKVGGCGATDMRRERARDSTAAGGKTMRCAVRSRKCTTTMRERAAPALLGTAPTSRSARNSHAAHSDLSDPSASVPRAAPERGTSRARRASVALSSSAACPRQPLEEGCSRHAPFPSNPS